MSIAFRPSGVSTNAALVATTATALTIPGKGNFVRVVNLSQVTSVASDIQPMAYVLFGNATRIYDADGATVTLDTTNGIGIAPGQSIILVRPENCSTLWHYGSHTGRIGVSTGEMA